MKRFYTSLYPMKNAISRETKTVDIILPAGTIFVISSINCGMLELDTVKKIKGYVPQMINVGTLEVGFTATDNIGDI